MKDNTKPMIVRGFNLKEIIIVIVTTALLTALATGLIVTSNYKASNGISYADLAKDANLQEFLNSYASVIDEYYEDVDKQELINSAIKGMMSYLGDRYSVYMDKNEANSLAEELAGEYTGIGIGILYNTATNETVIEKVYADTPAAESGFKDGDIIKKINGEDVTTKDVDTITSLIKQATENITITVLRGEELIDLTVSAQKILKPATNTDVFERDNKKIGYLQIERFSSSIYEQVNRDLKKLENQKITSLIIDLRDNTGGYLEETVKIANMFLEKNKIIYSLQDKNGTTAYKDNTKEKRDYKIVILINGSSASASEVLTGALKDSYGATIVGSKSFGKGKVQHAKTLSDETLIKYTSAYWLRPNGECVDNVGITPDYDISLNEEDLPDIYKDDVTEEEINTYNAMLDELYENQLNKAIEIAAN